MLDLTPELLEVRSSTWGGLNIASGTNATEASQIRAALFGDGSKDDALISEILIGSSKTSNGHPAANIYPNIHEILRRLGITTGLDVQDHFHLFLRPVGSVEISPSHNLMSGAQSVTLARSATSNSVTQADAQALLDYAQTFATGDELMFTMDAPNLPMLDTPIVLAQTAGTASGTPPQTDYILNDCIETDQLTHISRTISPAAMLYGYWREHNKNINESTYINDVKVSLLEGPSHGKLDARVSRAGITAYEYTPVSEYVGKDKASFIVEFEGKRYKIVVDLHVFEIVDEKSPTCPPPKLIKVNGKPVSSSATDVPATSSDLASWLNLAQLDGAVANAAGITVSIADLPGAAVGQTTGTNITFDTNAAGNGWFIDTTPADNSEYLPTSNPYEWVAKAGTDAYGKMDMLSVLLHEYGHALGIEHSADNHDYMATTLTPGVRRLPSTDELALMQQLVAQAKGEMVDTTDSTLSTATPPYPPYQGGRAGWSATVADSSGW